MKNKAPKSLSSILTLWFIAFTIIPLSFISGYSLVLYESAINNELQKRLEGAVREVSVTLSELERLMKVYGRSHAEDPTLTYHVSTRNISSARRHISGWLKTSTATRLVVFDRDGKLIVSQARDIKGAISAQPHLETGDFYLADDVLKEINKTGQSSIREVIPNKGLDIIAYTAMKQKDGRVIGYLEEVLELGQTFLVNLKKRLGLDALIFDSKMQVAAASLEDFYLYPKDYFVGKVSDSAQTFFDLTSRGEPMGMEIKKISDSVGKPIVTLGLAASKSDSQKVFSRIKITLLTVTVFVLILLIPTLIYVSSRVVKPIHQLVEATQKMEKGQSSFRLKNTSDTEVGLLIDSFNEMSGKISSARHELENKVKEVEKANNELKETQTSLVHSAKMASLGQLVAGVAHELNNPIGFIYSNMSHLKTHVEKLKKVLSAAEQSPEKFNAAKKEVDFDYIVEDLPKLIMSCEEGARRTRDIVVGLRNFSRLDEANIKSTDIHEGLRNTVRLLSGELKNRIKVHEDFAKLPEVHCYVSQLNQVFMNIISNAAQAVEKSGEIWLKTTKEKNDVFISIKDSGPGIAPEYLDKIFDPFFTTKPVGQGTGLGLSISYGIIKKHGGEITVKSQLGEGTEFIVRLPINGPDSERQNA